MFRFFEPNKLFILTSKAPKYVLIAFIIIGYTYHIRLSIVYNNDIKIYNYSYYNSKKQNPNSLGFLFDLL